MILTICPNPSIDCTIELDNLNVGMLNRIRNKVETYSGKALNAAIGISRLDEAVTATGFMFEDHATLFEQVLEKEGVKCDFIRCEGAARVNYKIIDKKSMLTEINDKGEKVSTQNADALLSKIAALSGESDIAVVSGSLPDGVSSDYYKKMVQAIPDRVKVILDTERENMNAALYGREIFMVKPNLRELEKFAEREVETFSDMLKAAKLYLDRGVKNVMISLGADGAILTDGIDNFYCRSATVAVNSTVGAGDSMVAAACVGLTRSLPMKEILRMSVAAGTASITTSGTNLFYKDKYEEIYSKIYVERI
ncbi:MAG: 1-phosphofructokinase family hexose kinase [Clostridia bacterium]|nr:1-phosphofructokinase family hexose kinase [Clostridia bacterium]